MAEAMDVNPTERVFLVGELEEAFGRHQNEMAIEVTNSLQVIRILCGVVTPVDTDSQRFYENLSLCLVHTEDRVEVSTLDTKSRKLFAGAGKYVLRPAERALEGVDSASERKDALFRRLLGLVTLTLSEAELQRERLFRHRLTAPS